MQKPFAPLFAAAMVLAGAWADTAPAHAANLPTSLMIGGLLPLTGNAGYLGEEIRQGLDIYTKAYEQTAQAKKLPALDFVYVDSQADARIGFQGYQRLATRDEAQLIVLTYTNVAIAAAPQANRNGTAMFNLSQGPVTELGKYFTSSIPTYSAQAEVAIKDTVDSGAKKLALIYEDTESFVRLNTQIGRDLCPKYGCSLVASEQIPAAGTDVSAQVTAALAQNPDTVFALGVATQLIPIMRELKTRKYAGRVISVSEIDNLLSSGNASLAEGVRYAFSAPQTDSAEYKQFADAYRAAYQREPTLWVANGYQAGQIIGAVIERMKAAGQEWTPANFDAALKTGTYATIFGDVRYGSDGRIREPLTLVQVENGQRKTVRVVTPDQLK